MWNIFENGWLLLTLAGVALVIASIVRQEKPEWGYKPLLVPLLLAVLAFGLDYWVTTDYEAVSGIVPACRKAAVAGNTNGIMRHISPIYTDSRHKNRAALQNAIERILPRASIKKIRFQSHVITINGDAAESECLAAVHLNTDSGYAAAGSLVFVAMRFGYEKIDTTWSIDRMEVTEVNYQPMNWGDIR
jgi:hypothetical protein